MEWIENNDPDNQKYRGFLSFHSNLPTNLNQISDYLIST